MNNYNDISKYITNQIRYDTHKQNNKHIINNQSNQINHWYIIKKYKVYKILDITKDKEYNI